MCAYNPGITDISGQLRAAGIYQGAQQFGQTADALTQNLANWQQKQEQNKQLLAQAKATESFIKSQPDLFGGQGVVDQITSVDPKESPMARYSRLAQYTKDAIGGAQLAQAKQQMAAQNQQMQAQAFILNESKKKKDEEDALNAKLDMFIKSGAGDPTMQQNPLIKLRSMGVTITPDMAAKLQGDMMANDSRLEVAGVRTLAQQQVAQARAEAAQSAADLAASKADIKAGAQAFDETKKLRDEVSSNPNIKSFDVVDNFYSRGVQMAKKANEAALQGKPTTANDMGLIFSLMKVYDPTSTVREGEYATASNSGTVPEAIMNTYNKLTKGGKLQPEQRADFINSMKEAAITQHEKALSVATQYAKIARKRGLDPEDVVAPNYFDWKPDESLSPNSAGSNLNDLLSKYPPRK